MTFEINYLAWIVSVIVYQVLGAIWYGPLLGKAWMAEVGRTEEEIRAEGGASAGYYLVAIVNGAIAAFVIANVIAWRGAGGLLAGLLTGLILWVGFVATTSATSGLFAGRTWRLWAIDGGYHLVAFLLVGVIISVWP